MLQALKQWLDDEQASQSSSVPRPAAADVPAASAPVSRLDAFNEHIAAVHLALQEQDMVHAVSLWHDLHEGYDAGYYRIGDAGAAGSSSASMGHAAPDGVGACPFCRRRVANVTIHARTCASRPQGNDAAASAAATDPQAEMIEATRQKLLQRLRAALGASQACEDIPRARSLWVTACGLNDASCTDAFASALQRHFARIGGEIRQRMDAARAIASMQVLQVSKGADRGKAATDGSGAEEWMYHPYFACHRRAVACALSSVGTSTGAHSDAAAAPVDPRAAPKAVSSLELVAQAVFGGTGSAEVEAARDMAQPHIDALATLLGEATELLVQVMAEAVPHSDRIKVVETLHATVVAAGQPAIDAYARDTMLTTTIAAAETLGAFMERLGRSRASDSIVSRLRSHVIDVSATKSGRGAERGVAAEMLASPAMLPLRIPYDVLISVVDEAADQLSFMCQVLERYCRCVSACLALGPVYAPSRLNDSLAQRMHLLQNYYVMFEQVYQATSTRVCILDARKWMPVQVTEDATALAFAWCDSVFFLLGKAIDRSSATASDMSAAAVVNCVATVIDDVVRQAAEECVDRAGHARPRSKPSVQPPSSSGTMENEIAEQLSAALLGNAQASAPAKLSPSPLDAAAAESADEASLQPPVADEAFHALNTLHLCTRYLQTLRSKMIAVVTATFPAGPPDGSAPAAAPVADPAISSCLPSLQPCLLLFDEAPKQFQRVSGRGFQRFAAAVAADALPLLTSTLSKQSYVIEAHDFEAVQTDNPVPSVFNSCVQRGCAMKAVCARLLKPSCCDTAVSSIAQVFVDAVLQAVSSKPIKDFGVLRMQEEVRHMHDVLAAYTSTASLRGAFARASQMVAVRGVENLAELYALRFPAPALTRDEVQRMLAHNIRFVEKVRQLGSVDWDRVQTVELGSS